MRIRTIKPEFWESESLGKVSRDARLLFIGLFSSCDDSGRTRASSRLLASRLYPYDDDALRLLPRWLKELEDQKCIRVYEVDGETYLDIPKWLSHQKIDHPSKSKIPEFREGSRGFEKNSLGSGIRDQGSGSGSGEVEKPREEEVEKKSRKGTLEEVQAACRAKGLSDTDSDWFFHKMEGNGWTVNGKAIKQWKSVVASWFSGGYFPSQNRTPGSVQPQRSIEDHILRL